MSNDLISRRTMLPAALAGAVAVALAEPKAEAAAAKTIRYMSVAGPAGITRNQTLISSFFVPAVQTPPADRSPHPTAVESFTLGLYTLNGILIGLDQFDIAAGKGGASVLRAFGDGSVRLNDKALNFTIGAGESVHIIAILIGLLLPAVQNQLPAVQAPAATMQILGNLVNSDGFDAGLGPVNVIIPFQRMA